MNFRVLWSPKMTKAQFGDIRPRMPPRVYDDRDDALAWCRDVIRNGGIAWSVEDDIGNCLTQSEIIDEIDRRARDLIGHPKKYG